jgi:hypothetical protein
VRFGWLDTAGGEYVPSLGWLDGAGADFLRGRGRPDAHAGVGVGVFYPRAPAAGEDGDRRGARWLAEPTPKAVVAAVAETLVDFVEPLPTYAEFEGWGRGKPRLPRVILFADGPGPPAAVKQPQRFP